MIDCVLIVVSYRSATDVAALLKSVPAAVGTLSYRVIVVNNDSEEDLAGLLIAGSGSFLDVINAGANLGYAGGLNVGLRNAPPSRYVAFLNPDLTLAPGSVATLCATAGSDRAAVPLVTGAGGEARPSIRREPSIGRALGEALFGDHWPARPGWLAEIVREERPYSRTHPIDWATGCALVVPASVIARVGPWDERFFLYSEETDYCRRLRGAGVRVVFEPAARVGHDEGGSGTSAQLHALLFASKLRYFRKWHRVPASTVFAAVLVLHCVLRVGRPQSRAALSALILPSARRRLPGRPAQ